MFVGSSTDDLLHEHLVVRRLGNIAQRCSDRLYANQNIPIEDIQIISVVIEEFVDAFHHGKEEKAYFYKSFEPLKSKTLALATIAAFHDHEGRAEKDRDLSICKGVSLCG